ncbi:MAG: nucleotidyl transferase AbiEii/AbiGii toxin family protein [Porticoccaceae bacterium]
MARCQSAQSPIGIFPRRYNDNLYGQHKSFKRSRADKTLLEDLDFRPRFETEFSANQLKKKKSTFRQKIIEALEDIEDISFSKDGIKKDGLGLKVQLTYPRFFDIPDGMRPDLQVEFSFTQPRLDAEHKDIASFVAEYKNEPAEAGFLCLSPVEIASDKFSSLIWRVLKRDREDEKDDPAILRHLHDLCALREIIERDEKLFIETALGSFAIDQERQNRQVGMSLSEAAAAALAAMGADELYRKEYEQFVDAMSYADDDEKIGFDVAIAQFQALMGKIPV